MPRASVSTDSAPATIGRVPPGFQIQIVSPIAASRAAMARTGIRTRWTRRPGRRPAMSTTTEPPSTEMSGDIAFQSTCGAWKWPSWVWAAAIRVLLLDRA